MVSQFFEQGCAFGAYIGGAALITSVLVSLSVFIAHFAGWMIDALFRK